MLTILGYSINDTVVIYDRIRENTGLYGKKMSLPELVNLSINQSFGRSMMTSITTCIALAIVCVVSIIFKLGQHLHLCGAVAVWHGQRCLQHHVYCNPAVGQL